VATRRKTDAASEGRAFFGRLAKEGAFAPIFAIYGQERFLVDEALRRLIQSVFPNGPDDLNCVTYQAPECKAADAVSSAQQVPMFASQSVVIIRNADVWRAADFEALAAYAAAPSQSTLVIIEAIKFDRRAKATQRFFASASVAAQEFAPLGERDVRPWLSRRAQAKGLSLDRDVVDYLVESVGTSLQQLDLALERVDLFLGAGDGDGEARRVTIATVEEIVPDTRARTVFELADHLSSRQLGAAIECFHRTMEQGESPIGALSMIARQFRMLLLVHDGRRLRLSDADMVRHVGCPRFRLDATVSAARRFHPARLKQILDEILRTDHALKSSKLPSTLLVERLLVSICSSGAQVVA
jgi:DNA polymerase-3 subunit delta